MNNSLPNIRAVFFDAGNTLLFPDYPFIQQILAEKGVVVSVDRLREAEFEAKAVALKTRSDKPWNLFFGTWFERLGVATEDLPAIFQILWERHRQKNLWSLVNEEAWATLRALKERKFKLGIISNSDGKLASQLIETGLAPYFETAVDSEIVGVRKPDPKIFHLALHSLNVPAREAVHVGDIFEIDVLGAQNAGLTAILFDPLGKFAHLDCLRITGLKEICDLLPGRPGN